MVFCHGFPELAYSWRHQLPAVAAAGFRAIAPDQRGYGGSSRPDGGDRLRHGPPHAATWSACSTPSTSTRPCSSATTGAASSCGRCRCCTPTGWPAWSGSTPRSCPGRRCRPIELFRIAGRRGPLHRAVPAAGGGRRGAGPRHPQPVHVDDAHRASRPRRWPRPARPWPRPTRDVVVRAAHGRPQAGRRPARRPTTWPSTSTPSPRPASPAASTGTATSTATGRPRPSRTAPASTASPASWSPPSGTRCWSRPWPQGMPDVIGDLEMHELDPLRPLDAGRAPRRAERPPHRLAHPPLHLTRHAARHPRDPAPERASGVRSDADRVRRSGAGSGGGGLPTAGRGGSRASSSTVRTSSTGVDGQGVAHRLGQVVEVRLVAGPG